MPELGSWAWFSGLGRCWPLPRKTYKYRCTKCKLMQEYGSPGARKCPNDGKTMVRMN
jgi:hypothetical protein